MRMRSNRDRIRSNHRKIQERKENMAEVEDAIKRISAHKGVSGIMIMNCDGIPIRTTLDNATTIQYCALMQELLSKARCCVRDVDPQNDLTFLRLRTKKHEIMIAPEKEYMLIVIQNPSEG